MNGVNVDEKIVLLNAVKTEYEAGTIDLQLLAYGDKQVYLITRTDGTDWVLRAVSSSARYNPLPRMATVLAYLEQHQFPAERLVLTRDDEPIARHEAWEIIVTTYLGHSLRAWEPAEGDAAAHDADELHNAYTPETRHQFAQALGQLHSLPVDDSLPCAGMLPSRELTYAGNRLAEIQAPIPPAHQAQYDDLIAAVHDTNRGEDFPPVFIHNDPNLGNVVVTETGDLALIDWDVAGLGPAPVDLGVLLSNCHTARYVPDAEAIAAVVDGYSQHRIPTAAELACLADLSRFQTLVLLAACFPERVTGELGDEQPLYGLTYPQWQAKYEVAGEIAVRAVERFAKYL